MPEECVGLVLFAHGSPDARWRAPFEQLARELQAAHPAPAVQLAYMEFATPSLEEAAVVALAAGIRRLRLLPLFMAGGGHVGRDIPRMVAAVEERHPGLSIEILPPVGEDTRVQSAIRRIASESLE
jgi:sirohydrochlorin cobaltochelatase